MDKELFDKIGNARVYAWDIDEDTVVTVNEYLRDLLLTLLEEGESFSGKRPFGNSGWEHQLPSALAIAGIVEYDLIDDNEEPDNPAQWEIDYDNKAEELLDEYIRKIFKHKGL